MNILRSNLVSLPDLPQYSFIHSFFLSSFLLCIHSSIQERDRERERQRDRETERDREMKTQLVRKHGEVKQFSQFEQKQFQRQPQTSRWSSATTFFAVPRTCQGQESSSDPRNQLAHFTSHFCGGFICQEVSSKAHPLFHISSGSTTCITCELRHVCNFVFWPREYRQHAFQAKQNN